MRHKLAIVGSHVDTRHLAPWNDPAFDVWVFNEAGAASWIAGRIGAVFQLHSPAVYRNPENKSDREHWAWLQQEHPFPIWMQAVDPLVPASRRYPIEEICAWMLGNFTWPDGKRIDFFTNSISYAIALALHQGRYDEIHLYGVEMSSNTEYHYQRVNVAFWTGLALGYSVRVVQHCAQSIYDVPRYGYDGAVTLETLDFERGMDEMTGRAEQAAAAVDQARLAQRVALQDGPGHEFETAHQALLDAMIASGQADGVRAEASRYAEKTRAMIAANGAAPLYRQEFEITASGAGRDSEQYKAMMNFDSGRAVMALDLYRASHDQRWIAAFHDYAERQLQNAYAAGVCDGRRQANLAYLQEVDERIRAAGGSKAMEALGGG